MLARSKEFWRRGDWFPLAELEVSCRFSPEPRQRSSHQKGASLRFMWHGSSRSPLGSPDMHEPGSRLGLITDSFQLQPALKAIAPRPCNGLAEW